MITYLIFVVLVLAQASDEPYQRFAAAYASLDADRVSRVYAEDALMLPSSGDLKRGRAVIRDHYAKGFASDRDRGHTRQITFELVARDTAGNLRNDVGYYTIVTRETSGHEERFRGKFLKVWRREADGVWRIRMESYSPATSR
jgi:uncharacterized protein (TIGR02246 family)